jgi:hypothetical protein
MHVLVASGIPPKKRVIISIIDNRDMMLAIADVQVFHFSDLPHLSQNQGSW